MDSTSSAALFKLQALAFAGGALLLAGVAFALYLALADPESLASKWTAQYLSFIRREYKFLWIDERAEKLAWTQLIAIVGFLVMYLATWRWYWLVLAVVVGVVPAWSLKRQHEKRVLDLERQLDGWLLVFANSLRATASIGDALATTASIVRAPMSQEVDLTVKETQLGASVDEALVSMSRRIGNRLVSAALSTIVIGRNTGGDLPELLETTAAALREAQRLEGVLRTKTAEGRAQVTVLAFVPFVMVGMLYSVDSEWLMPLVESFIGYIIIALAVTLWASCILIARKILAVDM